MPEIVVKRDGRAAAFKREKICSAIYRAAVACGGRDLQEAERVTDDVLRLLQRRQDMRSWPTVEEVQDLVEKALVERGHARTAKAYILYRYEHALKRAGRESLTYSAENIPYRKLWEALSWASDHDCVTPGTTFTPGRARRPGCPHQGRGCILRGRGGRRRGEDRHPPRGAAGGHIAGPSSSGKSTTTLKIGERLAAAGIPSVPLAVDNYFFDRDVHPKIGDDDRDFETPQALDLALINEHVAALAAGRSVLVPRYDFATGRRSGSAGSVSLPAGAVLLIDSLHGLFPDMTVSLPEEMKFRLYVETLSQARTADGRFVRWADVRLLRRVVRDMQFRASTPRSTIRHWPLVRRAELRYIVPELRRAHALVNSYLPYELPFMKARLQPTVSALLEEFRAGGEENRRRASGRRGCRHSSTSCPAATGRKPRAAAVFAAGVHWREHVHLSLTTGTGRHP